MTQLSNLIGAAPATLAAGEAIAVQDAIQVGPDNLAWKIRCTDTAAVNNAGDLSSTAQGQIQATTALLGASASLFSTGSLGKLPAVMQHTNGDIYTMAPSATGALGAVVTRWTAGGRKVNQVTLATGTANNFYQLVQLANGNVLASCTAGTKIYDANLGLVNATPMTWADSGSGAQDPVFIALAAGGYCVAFQSTTPANIKAGLADNTGATVVAIAVISTVGGGAGACELTGKQLNGSANIVIATRSAVAGAYMGVFNSTTLAAVSAMASISYSTTSPAVGVEIAVVPGFFALLLGSDGTNMLGGVYTNAGAIVGSNFTLANTTATNLGQFKLLSNGVDTFYALFASSTSNFVFSAWSTAAAFTNTTIAAGTSGFNTYVFDAFYEKGRVCVAINNTGLTNPKLAVINAAAASLIAAPFVFGTAATAAGSWVGLCSTGDWSFACIYETSNAVGSFIFQGKYQASAILGRATVAAAIGADVTASIKPGSYTINPIGGTNGRAFDQTGATTGINGPKGNIQQRTLILNGY